MALAKKFLTIFLPLMLVMVGGVFGLQAFGESIVLGRTGDFERKVGNGYILSRSSSQDVDVVREDVTGSGDAIIPSKVVALNVYHDWVFAKRQGLKTDPNNPTLQIPDDKIFDYRVLNTKANKAYIFSSEQKMRAFLSQQGVPNKPLLMVEEFKSKAWYQRWF